MKRYSFRVLPLIVVFAAFLVLAGAASAAQQVSFTSPTSYPSGSRADSQPVRVTNADFNEDGKVDLAVANQVDDSFSVFPGNGNGTFGSATNVQVPCTDKSGTIESCSTTNAIIPRPMGIASGDLNKDGHTDLAVTSPPNGGVFVFFGDGKGNFAGTPRGGQPNPTFLRAGDPAADPLTVRTFGVTIANLDADSKPDIAVTNLGSRGSSGTPNPDFNRDSISVFRNDPNQTGAMGTFGSAVNYQAGDSVSSIISADFDGDGNNDLAVTNDRRITGTSGDVSIFFGSRNGTFTHQDLLDDYSSGTDNLNNTTPPFPTAIASADLNGDGRPDLVVANLGESRGVTPTPNPGDDSVAVLLNTGSRTQHTNNNFAAPVTYDAGDGPRDVTIADFNGDGHPDFAVPYQNETTNPIFSVFLNNGDGSFAPRQNFTGGVNSNGITSADFNGDGKPDIATSENRASGQDDLLVSLNTTVKPVNGPPSPNPPSPPPPPTGHHHKHHKHPHPKHPHKHTGHKHTGGGGGGGGMSQ